MPATIENFDSVTPPALPAGYAGDNATWKTQASDAASSPNSLVYDGGDGGAAHFFGSTTIEPSPNRIAKVKFKITGSAHAGYLGYRQAAALAVNDGYLIEVEGTGAPGGGGNPGAGIRLSDGAEGVTYLGTLNGNFIALNTYYTLWVDPFGDLQRVYLVRDSDGLYLQPDKTFAATVTPCISVTDSTYPTAGYSVLAIYQPSSDKIIFDDLTSDAATNPAPDPVPVIHTFPDASPALGWKDGGSYLQYVGGGGHLERRIQDTENLYANFDISDLPNGAGFYVQSRIDGDEPDPADDIVVTNAASRYLLRSGLSSSVKNVELIISRLYQGTGPSWDDTAPGEFIRLASIEIDEGGTVSAPTTDTRPLMAAVTDSEGSTGPLESDPSNGGAQYTFVRLLAEARDMRYFQQSVPGRGIVNTNNAGTQVPTANGTGSTGTDTSLYFYDKSTAWGSPLHAAIDLELLVFGTNDNATNSATLATAVAALLAKARSKSATKKILFVGAPIQTGSDTGLQDGYDAYIVANPSDTKTKLFLPDSGLRTSLAAHSPDGAHLYDTGHVILTDALDSFIDSEFGVPVATPTFSPVAGAVASGTVITFASATAGVTFYSTIDGSTPTTGSTAGATRTVTSAQTIKVIAVKDGMTDSAVALAAYTIAAGDALSIGTLTAPTSVTKSRLNGFTFPDAVGGEAPYTYQVQRKRAADPVWTNVSGANTSPFNVTGLLPSTEYQVRVGVVDSIGQTDYTNTITATTDDAPAPSPGGGTEVISLNIAYVTPCTFDENVEAPGSVCGLRIKAAGTVTFKQANGQDDYFTATDPIDIAVMVKKVYSAGTDIDEEDIGIIYSKGLL